MPPHMACVRSTKGRADQRFDRIFTLAGLGRSSSSAAFKCVIARPDTALHCYFEIITYVPFAEVRRTGRAFDQQRGPLFVSLEPGPVESFPYCLFPSQVSSIT